MEKTKLVRTFGTALATATLSFGLFAGTALAKPSFTVEETQVAVIDTNNTVTTHDADANNSDKVQVAAKINEIDFEDLETPITGTVTAENASLKVEQEFSATVKFYDKKGTEIKAEDLADSNVDEVRFEITTNENMLNGEWTVKKVKIVDANDKYEADASASFKVKNGKKEIDHFPQLRVDTVAAYPKSVNKKINQHSVLMFDVYTTSASRQNFGNFTITATYLNPAGEEIEVTGFTQGEARDAGTDSGGQINTWLSNNLPNNVDGDYTLKSIKISSKDAESGITTSKTWEVETWDGDYEVVSSGVATIYRAYNPYDGQHLYTDSDVEYLAAVLAGWKAEGLAWYSPINELASKTLAPVYRVCNPYTGEHHFTVSKDEAVALVLVGWNDEGIAFYTTQDEGHNNRPVYRLFNPYATVGTHHYTTDKDEYDELVKLGWTGEGIGWYSVSKNWSERA